GACPAGRTTPCGTAARTLPGPRRADSNPADSRLSCSRLHRSHRAVPTPLRPGRTPMSLAKTFSTRRLLCLAALSALSLSACGTTDVDTGDVSENDSDAGPITVTDHSVEEITIDGPAQRVVTL